MDQHTDVFVDDGDQIVCRHSLSEQRPQGYPVVEILGGDRAASVRLYPTRARLERLREVIGAYLAAHPARGHDRRDIMGPPADEETAEYPLPAEAATGAVVDPDELLHSMASTFEPRRLAWDGDDPTEAEVVQAMRIRPREVP
jgi:hypothetical protein